MGRPGGAVRPLEDVRDAMREAGVPVGGGLPTDEAARAILALVSTVEDPRQASKVVHEAGEVVFLALCATMCDCGTWVEMEDFGRDRLEWLRRFSPYGAGVPSHDTIMRVMGLLSYGELRDVLTGFAEQNLYAAREALGVGQPKPHLAMDGKVERGTGRAYLHSAGGELRDLQTFHVWDAHSCTCIYSEPIDSKTNEIPVAQAWLADPRNEVAGSIVTADALHTQRVTCEIITSRGADYVLGLKGNQGTLHEACKDYFADPRFLARIRRGGTDYLRVEEKAHGQVEVRETYRVDPVEGEFAGWAGLASLVCQVKACKSTKPGSEPRTEVRYYISSLTDVCEIATAIRRHWICEIGHFHLDYSFGQDGRGDTDADRFENMATPDKLALALTRLMQATPRYDGVSIVRIRKMMARNPEEHLANMLALVSLDAFRATVEGLELTDADRRRYARIVGVAEAEFL